MVGSLQRQEGWAEGLPAKLPTEQSRFQSISRVSAGQAPDTHPSPSLKALVVPRPQHLPFEDPGNQAPVQVPLKPQSHQMRQADDVEKFRDSFPCGLPSFLGPPGVHEAAWKPPAGAPGPSRQLWEGHILFPRVPSTGPGGGRCLMSESASRPLRGRGDSR